MKRKYRIICTDEECKGFNEVDITEILVLIGGTFKCPYCRGFRFYVVPSKK